MKSTPTNTLQVECVDPLLSLRRQYLSNRFIGKSLQLSSHSLWSMLSRLADLNPSQRPLCFLLQSFLKFTKLPHPFSRFRLNPLFCTPYNGLAFSPRIILDPDLTKESLDTKQNSSL